MSFCVPIVCQIRQTYQRLIELFGTKKPSKAVLKEVKQIYLNSGKHKA
jgi:hypothetical protein